MSFRYARGALRPNQGYVCLPCRLQSLRITDSQRPRYQHAEALQNGSNAEEHATQRPNAKAQDRTGLKPKEGSSQRQAQPSDDGSKSKVCLLIQDSMLNVWYIFEINNSGLEVNGMQKHSEKRSIPKAQASKLEQDLQRQFAELRRQNLAKISLRPAPDTSEEGPKPITTSTGAAKKGATAKSKDAGLGRKARLKSQKLARVKKQLSSKSVTASSRNLPVEKGDQGTAVDDEEIEGKTSVAKVGRKAKTDANKRTADADLLKLCTDVQKLNKALKVDMETKGVGTEATNQNLPLPTKSVARSRSKETRKVVPASQAPSSKKKEAVKSTDTSKSRKHGGTLKIRKHPSNSTDPDAIVKDMKMKPHAAPSTSSPSPELSMTRRPPSLNAPPGTQSRKSADIKAVSAVDLEIKGKPP